MDSCQSTSENDFCQPLAVDVGYVVHVKVIECRLIDILVSVKPEPQVFGEECSLHGYETTSSFVNK